MQNFTVSEHEKLNTAVALGFFDGLHKGHRRVILSAVEQKKNGLLPVCFTFAQSPKEVLGKSSKGALMTTEDKLKTLEILGIEHTFSPDFKKLMNMSAKDFVEKIILATSTQNLLSAVLTIISEKTEKAIPSCSKSFVTRTIQSLM